MGVLTATSLPGLTSGLSCHNASRRDGSAGDIGARGRAAAPKTKRGLRVFNDARTGMPPGIPEGAMCVQRFDDSLNSAIHITYRISLRSSSMPEPRDPLLKVLIDSSNDSDAGIQSSMGPPGAPGPKNGRVAPEATGSDNMGLEVGRGGPHSVMIPPQVHLRRPCYDFYFL